jgi:hypothetical protein
MPAPARRGYRSMTGAAAQTALGLAFITKLTWKSCHD